MSARPAGASEEPLRELRGGNVAERLAAIRGAISEFTASGEREGEQQLAWGNWWRNGGWRNGGWGNWRNGWHNGGWHNWWHNW